MRPSGKGVGGSLAADLSRLFTSGTAAGLSDGELLGRFVADRDEAAFETLVARHGGMVLGVCRRLLRDPNDVDDAFQATFLILVRKARTLRRSDLLGNWLHGVAYRVSVKARTLAARRARAAGALELAESQATSDAVHDPGEIHFRLHAEVNRLPEKYRTAVVLCYLQGLTHDQAAARLGCPLGTVKGRLARAKTLLSKRLTRRGIALSATALVGELTLSTGRAAIPIALETATLAAARALAAGASLASIASLSPSIKYLAQGVLATMFWTSTKILVIPLVVAACTTAVAVVEYQARPGRAGQPANPQDFVKKGVAIPSTNPVGKVAVPQQPKNPTAGAPERADAGGGADFGGPIPPRREPAVERRYLTAIAKQTSFLIKYDPNPRNKALWKKLDGVTTMPFPNETSLSDVIQYVKQVTAGPDGEISIYLDPRGLGDVDATPQSKVRIDLMGIPLKTSLRLLLKQLGLAYCVRDGVLIVSSVDGIMDELAEAWTDLDGVEGLPQPSPIESLNFGGMMGGGGMM